MSYTDHLIKKLVEAGYLVQCTTYHEKRNPKLANHVSIFAIISHGESFSVDSFSLYKDGYVEQDAYAMRPLTKKVRKIIQSCNLKIKRRTKN